MRVYVGLVHYPVYNKNREMIASSVTTLDVHDIARLSRTYDVKTYYIITPLEEQQRLIMDILNHWTNGYGAKYNPDRKEALSLVRITSSLEDAIDEIEEREGKRPIIISTDANRMEEKTISYKETSDLIKKGEPIFLLLGTAWGLYKSVLDMSDYILEPIYGRSNYRHLSVRTAAAIIIDRLIGRYNYG